MTGLMDVLTWYAWLSAPLNWLDPLFQALSDRIPLPLAGIFLLGVLGAAAPCQMSTGLAALAFALRGWPGPRGSSGPLGVALAYAAGKALVYTTLGGLAAYLGSELNAAAVPLAQAARRLLGPVMILSGLYFFGLIPLRLTLGDRFSVWVEDRFPNRGPTGGFFLGAAFALAFCPTLFVLFFGTVIPRAVASPAGWIYPAAFAVGTALPLLAMSWALGRGLTRARAVVDGARRWDRPIRLAAGTILLLAGLNDLVVYWLL